MSDATPKYGARTIPKTATVVPAERNGRLFGSGPMHGLTAFPSQNGRPEYMMAQTPEIPKDSAAPLEFNDRFFAEHVQTVFM